MRALLAISFLLFAFSLQAQEVPTTTEQQLENLGDENLDDDALLQQLAFYRKNPLNLNAATAEDLYPLRFLTELQIQNLLRYRVLFGKLLSIYELQAVPGFDLLTIRKILPFVWVGEAQTMKEAFSSRLRGGTQTALFRVSRVLEKSKGYDTSLKTHYLGSADRLLLRYTYQYKNTFYYGVTAEKDAGEQFFSGAQRRGFDFYSLHFFARNLGRIKAFAVGDYTLNLGQGLTQWQSLAFGKSADVVAIKRQAAVILPYRSAGEFFFNRGVAATLKMGQWEFTPFVSYKKFSGNLVSDSLERFTSFGTSGYHRTRLEVEERYRLTDFSAGGNLLYRGSRLRAGLNFISHNFSHPLQKQNEPYNRFAPSGKSQVLASIDYSYTYKNMHVFGELAADRGLHRAFVQGALLSLSPKLDVSILYRNLAKEYQAPFGNAFTESNLPSNERGLYTGFQLRPATGWQVAAYADFYQFPFLRYRVSAPTRGCDYLLQLTYSPDKRTEVYLRYRTETKPLNEAGTGAVIQAPVDQERQNLRLNLSSQLSSTVSFRTRVEMTWFTKSERREEGYLAYAETAIEPAARWRGNFRLQYFETGGYDSRIYSYESDVLYSFSIPAFFDKGLRYYLNFSYQFGKKLTCWVRFAQTAYHNRATIGSGLDEITGNHRSEVKCQFRYQF